MGERCGGNHFQLQLTNGKNEPRQYVISSDVVLHPNTASCISGSRGYSSEEARCYGVGRLAEREHHYKSDWSNEEGRREERRWGARREVDNEDLKGGRGEIIRGVGERGEVTGRKDDK